MEGDDRVNGSMPKLRIRGLKKAFDRNVVLDGVDLDIRAGDHLVLLGASGSGKSVLVKCILGLMAPEAGSILIGGQETRDLSSDERDGLMRGTGVLFQNGALFDSLPVWRNVAFGLLHVNRLGAARAKAVAVEKLASVGLTPRCRRSLSGGAVGRHAATRGARARHRDRTGNPVPRRSDRGARPDPDDDHRSVHFTVARKLGATALTITQDVESARRMADRMAVLHGGKIIWEGPADAIDSTGDPHVDEIVRPSLIARQAP